MEASLYRFQSSPDPKAGCNRFECQRLVCVACVSILTRPEGRVQPVIAWLAIHGFGVSILTRPEGRVQQTVSSGSDRRSAGFNPHPTRRPGATAEDMVCDDYADAVSILTRPEGRVQQAPPLRLRRCRRVSILTRPEGRVQLSKHEYPVARSCFNPHPTRRPGATPTDQPISLANYLFQSSPDPKAGCNNACRSSSLPSSSGFNPHPTRRPGATTDLIAEIRSAGGFQSSPDPKAGCNVTSFSVAVSRKWFQSSPDPKAGCNGSWQ